MEFGVVLMTTMETMVVIMVVGSVVLIAVVVMQLIITEVMMMLVLITEVLIVFRKKVINVDCNSIIDLGCDGGDDRKRGIVSHATHIDGDEVNYCDDIVDNVRLDCDDSGDGKVGNVPI